MKPVDRRRGSRTERIQVPVRLAGIMDDRVAPIVRHWGMGGMGARDAESLARSCYFQGVQDVVALLDLRGVRVAGVMP